MCKAAAGDLGLHHFRAFIVFGSSVVILNANVQFTIWILGQLSSNDECLIYPAKYEKVEKVAVVVVVYRWYMGGRYRVQSTKYDTPLRKYKYIYLYSGAGEKSRSAIWTAFCFPVI